jgi:hypothetical protein
LESVAEKPFADLDPVWGNGKINSEPRVQVVYLTLELSANDPKLTFRGFSQKHP